jgi:hypothetical protein
MALSVTDSSLHGQRCVLSCDDCREAKLVFSSSLDTKRHPASVGWARTPRDLCPGCLAAAMQAALAPAPETLGTRVTDAA